MWRVWSLLSEIRGALAQGCSLVNEEWRPQFIARNRDGPRRNDVYAVCLSLLAWGSACGSLTPLTLQVCISARGAAANAVPARRPRRPPYSPPPPPPARAAAARTAAAAAVREAARPRRPVTAGRLSTALLLPLLLLLGPPPPPPRPQRPPASPTPPHLFKLYTLAFGICSSDTHSTTVWWSLRRPAVQILFVYIGAKTMCPAVPPPSRLLLPENLNWNTCSGSKSRWAQT